MDNSIMTSDGHPPFLPLEETSDGLMMLSSSNTSTTNVQRKKKKSKSKPSKTTHRSTSPLPMTTTDATSSSTAEVVDDDDEKKKKKKKKHEKPLITKTINRTTSSLSEVKRRWCSSSKMKMLSGKQIITAILSFAVIGLIYDAMFKDPKDRFLNQEHLNLFLKWVQHHPMQGLLAFLIVIAICVVIMLPIGTPLTLGCGYIYKNIYGWGPGVTIATLVSMGGSATGAVSCFLLGRYMMRDQVRQWIKKYPLFDAIDVASAEHGLRIMAMLYLTPILPLGPVSYMCGTTSMPLSSFALAKIASLPLMLLYVFIGASMGELMKLDPKMLEEGGDLAAASVAEAEELSKNPIIIISGIVLSFTMISIISYFIKKELMKILERQKKHKPGEIDDDGGDDIGAEVETRARRRRQNVDDTPTNTTEVEMI